MACVIRNRHTYGSSCLVFMISLVPLTGALLMELQSNLFRHGATYACNYGNATNPDGYSECTRPELDQWGDPVRSRDL